MYKAEDKHTQDFGGVAWRKESFGRPRYGGKVNINMDFQEMGFEGMDRINLTKNRDMGWADVTMVMNLGIP